MTTRLPAVRALLPDGHIRPCVIRLAHGQIEAVEETDEAPLPGLLALPGIVDLHGDAFERQLMPRPGVAFPPVPALIETDRQLLANGITTAFHGLTLSWEPGLRSADAARAFLAALDAARPHLGCITRLHLRFEIANLAMVDEVLGWIEAGRVDLLAFNDHVGDIERQIGTRKLGDYLGRSGLDEATFLGLFERVRAGRDAVPAAVERLAAAARGVEIPMISHDDNTPEQRLGYRALGCRICEFPFDRATARAAIEGGDAIVLGAPNVMRGGSHAKRLAAAEAAGEGLCTILTSDYYYPALLHAPFILANSGALPLGRAWDLVARNPALAGGLDDRGAIAPGLRADLILIDDRNPALPQVHATYVAGALRFAAGALPAG